MFLLYVSGCGMRSGILYCIFLRKERALIFCAVYFPRVEHLLVFLLCIVLRVETLWYFVLYIFYFSPHSLLYYTYLASFLLIRNIFELHAIVLCNVMLYSPSVERDLVLCISCYFFYVQNTL